MHKIERKIIMNSIVLTLILSLFVGCSGGVSNMELKDNEQIKIAIYPSSGGLSETYYFVLNADGELTVEEGTRVGDDMTQSPFIIKDRFYAYKSEKKQLSSSEIGVIADLANKVYECGFGISDELIHDSWDVQILYKGKVIKQNYWHEISPQVKELVDEFIKISPIKVDLREFS